MQLPIVKVAPIVKEHAKVFRSDFNNRRQFEHFENYVTGLIALDNKSMATIARCVLESADKTNLSRFFSEAPWQAERINGRRVKYMIEQTTAYRVNQKASVLPLDCLLYTSPSPRDRTRSRMPSSA